MRSGDFTSSSTGELVRISGNAWAFLPNTPPSAIELAPATQSLLSRAAHAVGRLDGFGAFSPVPVQFLIPILVRREAVASSRIEGTVTNLVQLLQFEEEGATDSPKSDAQEVLNYVRALEYGLNRGDGRSIGSSLVRELHSILLDGVRGGHMNPGNLRTQVVYIGNPFQTIQEARFVPPPPEQVPHLMRDLDTWLQAESAIPQLVRLAVHHYQFETIHPFSDGNGRTGRLLIPLLLGSWGLLGQPLLFLSRYLERHKSDYMDGLLRVSQTGDWQSWISFILEGLIDESAATTRLIQELVALKSQYRERYSTVRGYYVADALDMIFKRPVVKIRNISEGLGVAYNTAKQFVELLERDGVLSPISDKKRDRAYLAIDILKIVNSA